MARRLLLALAAGALIALPALGSPDASPVPTFTLGAREGVAFTGVADPAGPPLNAPYEATFVSEGAEPTILVDNQGRAILVGDHLGVLRSTDNGAHWTRLTVPFIPGNVLGSGIFDGWALAQDAAGTIYASTTDGAVINVASSVDGGASWQPLPSTLFVDGGGIADRPWLAARNNGQVAMIWNMGGTGLEKCAYSTDGALTFTQRSPAVPGLSGNGIAIGGLPAWMSNGHLVYAGNGGVGGGADTLYRYPNPPCTNTIFTIQLPPHGDQLSTQVATEPGNKIYVATPTAANDGIQLIGYNGFVTTGMKTIVVSPSTLKGTTFATIAARPGEIAVGWYGTTTPGDFQAPGFNGQWNVYVARVKDFWTATPQVRVDQVTTTANHVGGFCFQGTNCDLSGGAAGDRDLLDYWQLTYDAAGNVHLAYGHDGATANAEVRYAKLPVWT